MQNTIVISLEEITTDNSVVKFAKMNTIGKTVI